ncbi:hypothetical protein Hanom_Chr12g01153231 [Helianthus anomalus]
MQGFLFRFFNVLVQFWVLRLKGPLYVAMFKPLTIIIAMIMGVLFLGDPVYLGSVLGGSIITIGFYGVLWGKGKEDEEGALSVRTTTTPLLEPHDALDCRHLVHLFSCRCLQMWPAAEEVFVKKKQTTP